MNQAFVLITRYWVALIVLALVLIALGVYSAGYRLGVGFTLVRNGTLVIENLPQGTSLYTDSIHRSRERNGTARIALQPGTHTIIVEAPGMESWSELFVIQESAETSLHPLLIPTVSLARALEGEERRKADVAIWNGKFPTARAPLLLSDGCVEVRVNGNKIIAEPSSAAGCAPPEYVCDEESGCAPTIVYEAPEQVRALLSYPKRDDAIIVASGGMLSVIELDPREPRFIAQLWKGSMAFAGAWTDHSVVVTNGAETFEISLPQ